MSRGRLLVLAVLFGLVASALGLLGSSPASAATHLSASPVVMAQPAAAQPAAAHPAVHPATPVPPTPPADPGEAQTPGVSIDVEGGPGGRSQAITIIVLMTVLSVAPALLLLMTSFTKIAIVLAITRQAIGTPTIPPNQVIAGLAMFLSLFVMAPVVGQINDTAVQPYLAGEIELQPMLTTAEEPLRTFMLRQTGAEELQTMIEISGQEQPDTPEDVQFTTLVPAFVLSEIKTAFIIGFVIFVPFLVIDLVVASVLMSMGMMMLPPIMISLPFKILLFIMVDGWSLITTAVVSSYLGAA